MAAFTSASTRKGARGSDDASRPPSTTTTCALRAGITTKPPRAAVPAAALTRRAAAGSQRADDLGFGGRERRARMERYQHRADADLVAVGEDDRRGHARGPEERAVLAGRILQHGAGAGDDEPGVVPGDRGPVQANRDVGVTADDVGALGQRKPPLAPSQPVLRGPGRERGAVDRIGEERVADTMHRPDVARRARLVIQRLA